MQALDLRILENSENTIDFDFGTGHWTVDSGHLILAEKDVFLNGNKNTLIVRVVPSINIKIMWDGMYTFSGPFKLVLA